MLLSSSDINITESTTFISKKALNIQKELFFLKKKTFYQCKESIISIQKFHK